MKVQFSRETYHSYMILEPDSGDKSGFEEQMLVNQNSEYLLHFHPRETDGVRQYCYEITGMMDFVSCVNRRPVSCRVLKGMIQSLLGVCEAVNEYLLDPDCLFLEPDRIYMDVDAGGMHFAYIPGYRGDFLQGLRDLSECMLSAADHKDRECVMLVYELYRIVREADFSAASIRNLLQEESHEEIPFVRPEPVRERQGENTLPDWPEDDPVEKEKKNRKTDTGRIICCILGAVICLTAAAAFRFGWLRGAAEQFGIAEKYLLAVILFLAGTVLFLVMKLVQRRKEEEERKNDPYCLQPEEDFWKETDYPGGHYEFTDESAFDSESTMILSAGKGVRLTSMNKAVAGDLVISRFPSVLGVKAPEAQTVLACTGISRKHALLEEEAGRYYLSDLDSTNGTWLNGEKLRPNEKKVLVNEDLIAFADVRFMFFTGAAGDGR